MLMRPASSSSSRRRVSALATARRAGGRRCGRAGRTGRCRSRGSRRPARPGAGSVRARGSGWLDRTSRGPTAGRGGRPTASRRRGASAGRRRGAERRCGPRRAARRRVGPVEPGAGGSGPRHGGPGPPHGRQPRRSRATGRGRRAERLEADPRSGSTWAARIAGRCSRAARHGGVVGGVVRTWRSWSWASWRSWAWSAWRARSVVVGAGAQGGGRGRLGVVARACWRYTTSPGSTMCRLLRA